ncbi:MAG: hypothetical protein IKS65_00630 [Bacteroidales bacterium]|nr:hypothetical protein [Bacteroidales bacterium]
MTPSTWVLIGLISLMTIVGFFFLFTGSKKVGKKGSQSVVVPLMVQAFERLVLYLERIRCSVLVKRVFMPGMSRSDLQFALIQNVQDEFEHNLAQRLYVSEEVWMMIVLTKDNVLKSINEAFAANPDADAATMAQTIALIPNSLIDMAIIVIKKEFNNF